MLASNANVIIDSVETPWKGRFTLDVVRFRHRRFDGRISGERVWELWRRGPAAAVLPYDPVRDLVVVIEQFRLPAMAAGMAPVMVELCAGLADGSEPPEEIARREAREEMGLEVHRLARIGRFLLIPGGSDENCTLFAAEVKLGEPGAEGLLGHFGLETEHEDIRVRALPAPLAIERAIAGEYPNSVCAIGLLWLAARRDWLRGVWGAA